MRYGSKLMHLVPLIIIASGSMSMGFHLTRSSVRVQIRDASQSPVWNNLPNALIVTGQAIGLRNVGDSILRGSEIRFTQNASFGIRVN
jgi:hypothetical protein